MLGRAEVASVHTTNQHVQEVPATMMGCAWSSEGVWPGIGRSELWCDATTLEGAVFLPFEKAGGEINHSTSKMHSISTAMLPGRALWPTALRVPTPASSPNTSRISSEKPLITWG
jgi:hypothetical protein